MASKVTGFKPGPEPSVKAMGGGAHGTPAMGGAHHAVVASRHDPRSAKGGKSGGMKGGKC
jgi:hypothetical protein